MQPRDVFDSIVVALVAAVVYVEVFGVGISTDRVDAVVAAITGLGIEVYLLGAAILGLVFLGYIAIYAPERFGTETGP